jgi:ribose 5-phosphate isomerase
VTIHWEGTIISGELKKLVGTKAADLVRDDMVVGFGTSSELE